MVLDGVPCILIVQSSCILPVGLREPTRYCPSLGYLWEGILKILPLAWYPRLTIRIYHTFCAIPFVCLYLSSSAAPLCLRRGSSRGYLLGRGSPLPLVSVVIAFVAYFRFVFGSLITVRFSTVETREPVFYWYEFRTDSTTCYWKDRYRNLSAQIGQFGLSIEIPRRGSVSFGPGQEITRQVTNSVVGH